MSADEVTASTLSKDQDMREADEPAASKKAAADIAKLEKDIEAAKSLATTVQSRAITLRAAIARSTGRISRKLSTIQGKIQESLEALLNLEKQSRLAEDVPSTTRCCLAVVDVCHDSGDWKMLNENILLLSKRRAQLKQVFMR